MIHGLVDLYIRDLGIDLSHEEVVRRLEGYLPKDGTKQIANAVLKALG